MTNIEANLGKYYPWEVLGKKKVSAQNILYTYRISEI